MVEPLSLKSRRVFATALFLALVVVLPIVGLYASGYRFTDFAITSTGGIYVSVPFSSVAISLNGEEVERSSLFSKAFFIDNLTPGSYVIQTDAEGYMPWSKTIIVEPRVVTDVSALLLDQPVTARELLVTSQATSSISVATSSDQLISPEAHAVLLEQFATTTPKLEPFDVTSAIVPEDREGDVEIFIGNGDLIVRWLRHEERTPSFFCLRPSSCVTAFSIENGKEATLAAAFFGRGVVYQTESGIYFTEVDIRPPQLVVPVYPKPGSNFRIIENHLYVQDGELLYEIEGLR